MDEDWAQVKPVCIYIRCYPSARTFIGVECFDCKQQLSPVKVAEHYPHTGLSNKDLLGFLLSRVSQYPVLHVYLATNLPKHEWLHGA